MTNNLRHPISSDPSQDVLTLFLVSPMYVWHSGCEFPLSLCALFPATFLQHVCVFLHLNVLSCDC